MFRRNYIMLINILKFQNYAHENPIILELFSTNCDLLFSKLCQHIRLKPNAWDTRDIKDTSDTKKYFL